MKLTNKITILDVARRWKEQYFHGEFKGWAEIFLRSNRNITADQVYLDLMVAQKAGLGDLDFADKIIGNSSWTHNSCSHCGVSSREILVSFDVNGGEYSYELCEVCLRKSLDILMEGKNDE